MSRSVQRKIGEVELRLIETEIEVKITQHSSRSCIMPALYVKGVTRQLNQVANRFLHPGLKARFDAKTNLYSVETREQGTERKLVS